MSSPADIDKGSRFAGPPKKDSARLLVMRARAPEQVNRPEIAGGSALSWVSWRQDTGLRCHHRAGGWHGGSWDRKRSLIPHLPVGRIHHDEHREPQQTMELLPAISGANVAWEASDGDDREIYMTTIPKGPSPPSSLPVASRGARSSRAAAGIGASLPGAARDRVRTAAGERPFVAWRLHVRS
jgi:hypothetical protein